MYRIIQVEREKIEKEIPYRQIHAFRHGESWNTLRRKKLWNTIFEHEETVKCLYGWKVSQPETFSEPLPLPEGIRAPQSLDKNGQILCDTSGDYSLEVTGEFSAEDIDGDIFSLKICEA